MKTPLVALAFLVSSIAVAEPTQQQLEDRAKALQEQLAGRHFTIFVEAPFVIVGEAPNSKKIATGFLREKRTLLEKDFFAKRPDKVLEVWLFRDAKTFRKGAKEFFKDPPDTPFGYYSPDDHALVMNVDGLGTLSHELVHPYMEANFPDVPSWFNEGLASLFEYPSERKGHIVGLVNWRLPNLKKEIRADTLPPLTTLLATSTDAFYGAEWDAYAQARYLVYYLQEHELLHAFFEKFQAGVEDDATGQASLEAVLGEDLATFEPKWRKWVLALRQ